MSSDKDETVSRLLLSFLPAPSLTIIDSANIIEKESSDESFISKQDTIVSDVVEKKVTIWISCNPVTYLLVELMRTTSSMQLQG